MTELFQDAPIGMRDKNGNELCNGDRVRVYYKGEFTVCKIIYAADWAMFCLEWPDGYKNKFPLSPERYEKI